MGCHLRVGLGAFYGFVIREYCIWQFARKLAENNQNLPDIALVIANVKLLLDQLGHAWTGIRAEESLAEHLCVSHR